MTLDEAIAHFAPQGANVNHAVQLCAALGGPSPDALNKVAVRIAQLYLQGHLDFSGADSIANSLFGYVTMSSDIQELPEPMYGIFLAFDAGEYYRKGDLPDVDPAEKYTMPLLREVLANHSAA